MFGVCFNAVHTHIHTYIFARYVVYDYFWEHKKKPFYLIQDGVPDHERRSCFFKSKSNLICISKYGNLSEPSKIFWRHFNPPNPNYLTSLKYISGPTRQFSVFAFILYSLLSIEEGYLLCVLVG